MRGGLRMAGTRRAFAWTRTTPGESPSIVCVASVNGEQRRDAYQTATMVPLNSSRNPNALAIAGHLRFDVIRAVSRGVQVVRSSAIGRRAGYASSSTSGKNCFAQSGHKPWLNMASVRVEM
jgi:hypothetical protein